MQIRSALQHFPWAGTVALALALGATGLILWQYPPNLASLTQPWYLTRASGLVAYTLLWASTATGLLQASGFVKRRVRPAAVLDFHDFLASLSLYAATVHSVVLLWDRYVGFTVTEILVPFVSGYKPLLVGIGTLAFYIALGVTISSYLQGKFQPRTWRRVHQTSLAAYVLVLIHGLVLGTDSQWVAAQVLYAATALSLAVLAAYRFAVGQRGQAN